VANAQQSKHQYYPSIQTSLPHEIKVQLIPAGDPTLELDISIGAYLVNGLSPDNTSQFALPNMNAFRVHNLAQPQASTPPTVAPPQSNDPRSAYRGVPWDERTAR
jgi:hypothetical protein